MCNSSFNENESLHKAILSRYDWESEGRLTSALFKDSKGVSVDRSLERTVCQTSEYLRGHITDAIGEAIVTVQGCKDASAHLKHDPIVSHQSNPFHSLILKSENEIPLTSSQARHLAKSAKFLGYSDEVSNKIDEDKRYTDN